VVRWNGEPIANVRADNLSASVHRKPVKILSVEPHTAPSRIFLIIDKRMSVSKDGWDAFLLVAGLLVSRVPTATSMGVLVFAPIIQDYIPPTLDRKPIRTELEKLATPEKYDRYAGNTTIWDAFDFVHEKMGQPTGADVIYALTDGEREDSGNKTDPAVDKMIESGVRIFSFSILYHDPDISNWDGFVLPRARQIDGVPERSGGLSVAVWRDKNELIPPLRDRDGKLSAAAKPLDMQFSQIFDYLTVRIELPERLSKTRTLSLKTAGSHWGETVLFYPEKLASCATVKSTAPSGD